MTEKMYSFEYMQDGNLFSMHVLATEKEMETHAKNLNGTYEDLNYIGNLPDGFEYVYHGTSH